MAVVRAERDVFHVRGHAVNWVVLRDGRDLTLIDTGYPGDLAAVEESIARIGHQPRDIRAILITHCHIDHVGGASRLARRYGIPVYVHAREMPLARGEVREQASPLDVARRCWRPRIARWALGVVRAGGTRPPVLPEAVALVGDGPLDLPGRPTPLPSPGHTSGHCGYLVSDAGAVLTGDALVTDHPTGPGPGPQVLAAYFCHSPAETVAGLDVFATAPADLLLPGHGPLWRGDPRRAVDEARAHAPAGYHSG